MNDSSSPNGGSRAGIRSTVVVVDVDGDGVVCTMNRASCKSIFSKGMEDEMRRTALRNVARDSNLWWVAISTTVDLDLCARDEALRDACTEMQTHLFNADKVLATKRKFNQHKQTEKEEGKIVPLQKVLMRELLW